MKRKTRKHESHRHGNVSDFSIAAVQLELDFFGLSLSLSLYLHRTIDVLHSIYKTTFLSSIEEGKLLLINKRSRWRLYTVCVAFAWIDIFVK